MPLLQPRTRLLPLPLLLPLSTTHQISEGIGNPQRRLGSHDCEHVLGVPAPISPAPSAPAPPEVAGAGPCAPSQPGLYPVVVHQPDEAWNRDKAGRRTRRREGTDAVRGAGRLSAYAPGEGWLSGREPGQFASARSCAKKAAAVRICCGAHGNGKLCPSNSAKAREAV